MFILFENILRSFLYSTENFVSTVSGVHVVDGSDFGVRTEDPKVKTPTVSFRLGDIESHGIELGFDNSSLYEGIFTVTTESRRQRDALKSVLYYGIKNNSILIYEKFRGKNPVNNAKVISRASLVDPIIIKDMDNFSSGREKFFWISYMYIKFIVIGI